MMEGGRMMEVENNVAERFDGDCAVNGDYHELPDELNQSRDNGGQDDDGDQDDQQGGNGMANGLKLANGRVIKKAKRQAKATSFSEDGGGVMVAPWSGQAEQQGSQKPATQQSNRQRTSQKRRCWQG